MQLQLDKLFHHHGARSVLRGLSLELDSGEIGCILGGSGCGKTTVLRCIAGFENIDAGEIHVGGVQLSSGTFTVPPERRLIGMVFQEATLLPHLSVARNVAFGLRELSPAEQLQRVEKNLQLVGLAGLADRFPHELSGGQQQRVALARAMAPQPRLILLDEPFANLDVSLRQRLGREVRDILKTAGVTALLVTHDQQEAFSLADRIGIMRDGVIEQWATPHQIYHRPVSREVAAFVGSGVFLPGIVRSADAVAVAGTEVSGTVEPAFSAGQQVEVLLRPDDIVEDPAGQAATVQAKSFRGPTIIFELLLENGEQVLASLSADRDYEIGTVLKVAIAPAHLVLFSRRS